MRQRLERLLSIAWVDRLIGAVAVSPFAVTLFLAARNFELVGSNVPGIAYMIEYALAVVTMVTRRPPKSVSFNPWYWALTFATTYWGFLSMGLFQPGTRAVPAAATDAIALLSLAGVVWSRLSLGRNIGCVPARRELVVTGPYRLARHPLYSAVLLGLLGFGLEIYSPRNAALIAVGAALYLAKSLTEEDFLKDDPDYAAYMKAVRWRWLPGLI